MPRQKTLQELQAEQALLGSPQYSQNSGGPNDSRMNGLMAGADRGTNAQLGNTFNKVKQMFMNGQGQPTAQQVQTSPAEQQGYAMAQKMLQKRYPNADDGSDDVVTPNIRQQVQGQNQTTQTEPSDQEVNDDLAQFEGHDQNSDDNDKLKALQQIKQLYGSR